MAVKVLQLSAAILLLHLLYANSVESAANAEGAGTNKTLINKIFNIIEITKNLLADGRELVVGFPERTIFAVYNEVCSFILGGDIVRPVNEVDASKLRLLLLTNSDTLSVPIKRSKLIWTNKNFRRNSSVVIFVTGLLSNINKTNEARKTLHAAYRARGNVNFLFYDTYKYVDTLYEWSSINTESLGFYLAKAIAGLVKYVPAKKIHLIGHSLGAHIMGTAAENFQKLTGTLLGRVTGLDPAYPCFGENLPLTGVMRGKAKFVDIIHTNSGVLGQRSPIGDADFYPNGVVTTQPGCLTTICSHERAWALYAETVNPGKERNMMGTSCDSLLSLRSQSCSKNPQVPMGYATPKNANGKYFLETNKRYPFGKG